VFLLEIEPPWIDAYIQEIGLSERHHLDEVQLRLFETGEVLEDKPPATMTTKTGVPA
jgi:hypothetical protein